MKKYKCGLVSISFRDSTPEEILKAMVDARLTCIEWGSDIHAPCNDAEKLKYVAELQEKYNIECVAYGTYFRLGVTPIDELPAYIEAAKILKTNILRLWCGNLGFDEYNQNTEAKKKLFEDSKAAAKIAEKAGVTLCLECHNNTYTDVKEGSYEIINAVSSPNFKMYWQPNQFKSLDENLKMAELLAPYTTNIHVFNWVGKENFQRDELPLEGAIDTWRKYLSYFTGEHALLLEFMPDNRIESLKREAEALFEIVGGNR